MVDIRKDYIGTLTQHVPNGEDIFHGVLCDTAFNKREAIANLAYLFNEFLPDSIGVVTVVQESLMEEGLKRNCSNCGHFDCNNDKEYEHEYPEGSAGKCGHPEGLDHIEDGDTIWSELQCSVFIADEMLVEFAQEARKRTEYQRSH